MLKEAYREYLAGPQAGLNRVNSTTSTKGDYVLKWDAGPDYNAMLDQTQNGENQADFLKEQDAINKKLDEESGGKDNIENWPHFFPRNMRDWENPEEREEWEEVRSKCVIDDSLGGS